MTSPRKWTSQEIIAAVRRHYGAEKDGFGPEWSALQEFSLRPGVGYRRADLFLVRAWAGGPKRHERILIEVKVSRGDFLREIAQPQKMAELASVAHRVYYATPEGVIKDTDDLGDVGHILIRGNGARIVRPGKRNPNPQDVPEGAFVEAFRRASRAEARERSAGVDPVSQVLALQKQVAQLQRREQNLVTKDLRQTSALNNWTNILMAVGGVPCHCGAMLVKPKKADVRNGRWYHSAVHADGTECPKGYPSADFIALVEMILERQQMTNDSKSGS